VADSDRLCFLTLLETVCAKAEWTVHAYCLMPNHYHLVVEIGSPTLSSGIQWLNGVYAQTFNRRHSSRVTCSRGASTRCWSRPIRICSSSLGTCR
jgi:REP element-mobilizing transposase RayT